MCGCVYVVFVFFSVCSLFQFSEVNKNAGVVLLFCKAERMVGEMPQFYKEK